MCDRQTDSLTDHGLLVLELLSQLKIKTFHSGKYELVPESRDLPPGGVDGVTLHAGEDDPTPVIVRLMTGVVLPPCQSVPCPHTQPE